MITISAKQSYAKSHDRIKIVMSRVEFCTIDSVIRGYQVYKDTTTSTRILGILLGISSHKRGTVARANQSLRAETKEY